MWIGFCSASRFAAVRAVACLGAVLLWASPAFCQDYDGKPFNPALTELPANYRGVDVKALIDALLSLDLKPRGEFETQAQYQQRLKAQRERKLVGDIVIGSRLALAFPIDASHTRYDIDRGILNFQEEAAKYTSAPLTPSNWTFGVPYAHCRPINDREFRGMDGMRRRDDCYRWVEAIKINQVAAAPTRTYSGQTAFGVQVPVNAETINYFGISVVCTENCPSYSRQSFRIPFGVQEAQHAKENTNALIIGRIRMPSHQHEKLVSSWTREQTPTISAPQHIKSLILSISFSVESVWLFDRTTGKIYRKIAPSAQRTSSSTSSDAN